MKLPMIWWVFLLLMPGFLWAEIRVAVASNFARTAEKVAAAFEQESGSEVDLVVGSTGKLYAQIRNGAPFDVFLAADGQRPMLLRQSGHALVDPVTYAVGEVVLWAGGEKDPQLVLKQDDFRAIALANPEVAPYGQASRAVMQAMDRWERLRDRVVRGESVGQAYHFVASGQAELGFVARSQVMDEGKVMRFSVDCSRLVTQQAVLLRDGQRAREFFDFLTSPTARQLIESDGYQMEARGPLVPELEEENGNWSAVWVTLRLALFSTLILLVLGTPLAWWLVKSRSRLKPVIEATVALPLVLPPTVLGFYLLLALGPQGPLGKLAGSFGGSPLVFSFWGLLMGSVIYSLPFVVQPLQAAFAGLGDRPGEVAATLRAGPWDRFRSVIFPLTRTGFISAAVLGFAHTLGEFGVVLMIGGNIPGETRVLSIAIYDHVEALRYEEAHQLAGGLFIVSFLLLLAVYVLNKQTLRRFS